MTATTNPHRRKPTTRTRALTIRALLAPCWAACVAFAAAGCAPRARTPGAFDVEAAARREAARPRWSTADSAQVAPKLARRCLRAPGLAQLATTLGRLPRLRFHPSRDATGEQVDIVALVRLLESEFLASGKVQLLAPTDERHDARIARREGDRPPTPGHELQADAVLLLLLTKQESADPHGRGPVVYRAELALTQVPGSVPLCRAAETRRKKPRY